MDVSGDGKVNSNDVVFIYNFYARVLLARYDEHQILNDVYRNAGDAVVDAVYDKYDFVNGVPLKQ